MKVLVVNLLRLGDFLMLTPTLKGLKKTHQKDSIELHVLVHPEVLLLRDLFPEVDQWHTLDRRKLQTTLGTSDSPFFLAHDVLEECLAELDRQNYDSVMNLTHTQFSAWICGAIRAKDRVGWHYDLGGRAGIHSSWLQYLNNQVAAGAKDFFHLSDIFFYSAGLTGAPDWELKDTPAGLAEARSYITDRPLIALQTLTSDTKKNWSPISWIEMMKQIRARHEDTGFVLLGSPHERERLEDLSARARAKDLEVSVAICGLEGALAIIRQSQLLITGDTSIKHLACGTDTPVIEVSLGSSDWRATGAYKQDSLILQANIECTPCPHSKACHQPTHVCAERVTPEVVARAALLLMDKRFDEIASLAEASQREVRIMRTHISPMGFWMAAPLGSSYERHLLETAVDRSTWKFVLQREYTNPLAQFGSEGLQIKRWLQGHLNEWNVPRLNEGLNFIESETSSRDQEINSLINTLRRITNSKAPEKTLEEAMDEIRCFFESDDLPSGVTSLMPQIEEFAEKTEVVPISGMRKVQTRLDEDFNKVQIKLKLIRCLKSQLADQS